MLNVSLTLKNFRCFDDSDPVHFDVKSGVTAFVGPNNSGKSSILRMFYELRNAFNQIGADEGATGALLSGQTRPASLLGVPDPSAVLCDRNQRPMTVRIDTRREGNKEAISSIELKFDRDNVGAFSATAFTGPRRDALPHSKAKRKAEHHFAVSNREVQNESFAEQAEILRDSLYIGPFRNILNQGQANYYDLNVGTSFVQTWDNWKNGHNREHNRAIKEVENAIAHLFGFSSLEINPSPDNNELRVFVDNHPFSLHEQGAGLSQFIVTFGAAATRRPSLILIDEPELNLHPSLQVDFLTTLSTFASEGVVLSTHSIGLARSVADSIYSVRREGNRSIVRLYDETPNLQEFAGELGFSAFRELGYDRILLVEGPTDVRTVQQILRMLNKDHKIVVFPLLGHAFASGDHSNALEELNRIAPADKIAALVDSERECEGGEPDPKRKAFSDACNSAGFYSVLVTERRAIENYFSSRAIKQGVGEQYEALGPYEALGKSSNKWSKKLNWKIAHAMEINDLKGTDLLGFLESL
ncbi:hypothetical protein D6C00_08120 [Thiohalobacter thiocyanaticus]|uniref:ATPase AAA-type core domain-containing protein n=2 Tax=Thiohalobacter thiocyanaticus TaxID=585455 RepID=A0A426QJM7_9GAMM|nr:hypothetical protein D6C00_08120 [Thiohalobacter thiocyanaticus]